MEQPKVLILHGDSDTKLALGEVLREGPYDIYFAAQTGTNGLKNPQNGAPDVVTADLRLRNINGITGLKISSIDSIEARLVVITSAATLNLTEEPLELDFLGKLDIARQKEELQETSCRSPNSQSHWKVWLESFLEANYSNPDLCFDDVRREFRFSRSYGCRLFKQHLGKPFKEKLREIRIVRAARLITETTMFMKEIAAECGFHSSKRLCEAFVWIHGVSPMEYRNRYFKEEVNSLIMNILQLLIFPPILLYINWKLALISLAALPFDTILVIISKRHLRRVSQELTEASADLSAISFESLAGIRTVQALGLETTFYDKLRGRIWGVSKLQIKLNLLSGGFGFLGLLITTTGTLAYGWYGWTQVLQGSLSLGSYMAFSAYVGYLYGPINNLVGLVQQVELTLVHINRFFEIYELNPAIQDRSNMPTLPQLQGEIQFNGVVFCYQENQPVLRYIDLHIPAKTTVALVFRPRNSFT